MNCYCILKIYNQQQIVLLLPDKSSANELTLYIDVQLEKVDDVTRCLDTGIELQSADAVTEAAYQVPFPSLPRVLCLNC